MLATVIRHDGPDQLIDDLIELAGFVDVASGGPGWKRRTSETDASLQLVLDAVRSRGSELTSRVVSSSVLSSNYSTIFPDYWELDLVSAKPTVTWKPKRALWSSPAFGTSESTWTMRTKKLSIGVLKEHLVRLHRPPIDKVLTISSLKEAVSLGKSANEVIASINRMRLDGIEAIDFSWECVIEAEVDGLLNEKSSSDFPIGLGTECTLWLVAPRDAAQEMI